MKIASALCFSLRRRSRTHEKLALATHMSVPVGIPVAEAYPAKTQDDGPRALQTEHNYPAGLVHALQESLADNRDIEKAIANRRGANRSSPATTPRVS